MKRVSLLLRLSLWLIASGAALTACSKQEPAADCCPCGASGATRLDEHLLSLLSAARAHHHQANVHVQQGQVGEAITAMRRLLALELDPKWPEAEEARLDASARLAKLLAGQGELEQALALVDGEIQKRPRTSFYLANVHAVRGELLEARSKALDAAGKKDQAREVAREAIEALERSIAINKQLQRRLEQPPAEREEPQP